MITPETSVWLAGMDPNEPQTESSPTCDEGIAFAIIGVEVLTASDFCSSAREAAAPSWCLHQFQTKRIARSTVTTPGDDLINYLA
ncbi:MAG: hypothetical protein U0936_00245 [Planctomycetaceae bacterium]